MKSVGLDVYQAAIVDLAIYLTEIMFNLEPRNWIMQIILNH